MRHSWRSNTLHNSQLKLITFAAAEGEDKKINNKLKRKMLYSPLHGCTCVIAESPRGQAAPKCIRQIRSASELSSDPASGTHTRVSFDKKTLSPSELRLSFYFINLEVSVLWTAVRESCSLKNSRKRIPPKITEQKFKPRTCGGLLTLRALLGSSWKGKMRNTINDSFSSNICDWAYMNLQVVLLLWLFNLDATR